MSVITAIRRAFAANPNAIPATAGESAVLESCGIQQPINRNYLAWRRSLMIFVVITSLLGAGLATYRDTMENSERVDVIETIAARFPLAKLAAPAALDVKQEIENAKQTLKEEGEEEQAPAGDTKNDTASELHEEADHHSEEPTTAFERFTDAVSLAAYYIIPIAALAVIALWTRLQLSFQILVAAFAFSFLVPMLIALCPWSWWGYVEPVYSPKTQPIQYYRQLVDGLLEGLTYLVTLLPTVLSLVPGVQKACIRVKLLVPQSTLPGWFLVVASPFYAMFLLVAFVGVSQFESHILFSLGMLLFLIAPLWFTVRSEVFTKPHSSADDERGIRGVQQVVGLTTAVAGILLLISLTTRDFMGIRLVGLDYKTSLMIPLDIVEFLLEMFSRSMFMTVLGADLFMRMNVTAWKHAQAFQNSPEAMTYDQLMGELQRA